MDFSDIQKFLADCSEKIENNLDRYYNHCSSPPQLIAAIRYASLGSGKKIRPALIYATAETYQMAEPLVDDIACSTELIHAYSLIHDDLPAMDDDDFRRSKPTVHKKFGEAIAILAGDAMHALAFEILAKSTALNNAQKIQIITLLAYTAGTAGMCGGQAIDIQQHPTSDLSTVKKMHQLKTGALIAACIKMPLFCADITFDEKEYIALEKFSYNIGLCFQIRDDILDCQSNNQTEPNKSHEKLTYPSVLGLEETKSELLKLEQQCLEHLAALNRQTDKLTQLTHYITQRTT